MWKLQEGLVTSLAAAIGFLPSVIFLNSLAYQPQLSLVYYDTGKP